MFMEAVVAYLKVLARCLTAQIDATRTVLDRTATSQARHEHVLVHQKRYVLSQLAHSDYSVWMRNFLYVISLRSVCSFVTIVELF